MACFRSAKVIPRRHWAKKGTERRASLYGACPWTGAPGDTADDWELVVSGFALECISHRGTMTIQAPQYAPYTLSTIQEALEYGAKVANEVSVSPELEAA